MIVSLQTWVDEDGIQEIFSVIDVILCEMWANVLLINERQQIAELGHSQLTVGAVWTVEVGETNKLIHL